MAIKAILFDIDGTLIDSNDLHVSAWEEAFAEFGETIDRQTIHGQIGKGADMLIPTLLPEADAAERAAIADAHGRIFKTKYLAHAQPFPNARNLMAHAQKAGQTIVLASSASAEELDHYVDLLGARDLVTATTSSDDVEHTKPAPDIFVTALGKLPGIGRDEVIVIGDTPYDIEAALKSQIATVAVRSGGFPDQALREAGAIRIYSDVSTLLDEYAASPLADR